MKSVIDNSNLVNMCRDCGAGDFLPEVSYAYDATAKTVTVTNTSTMNGTDTLVQTKIKVHDFFGGTVNAVLDDSDVDQIIVVDVSSLDASKPLALNVIVKTTAGIIADGGAYGLQAAGDVSHWDVQKTAAV